MQTYGDVIQVSIPRRVEPVKQKKNARIINVFSKQPFYINRMLMKMLNLLLLEQVEFMLNLKMKMMLEKFVLYFNLIFWNLKKINILLFIIIII